VARNSAHSIDRGKQIASSPRPDVKARLDAALAAHRAGDWAEAERRYAKVLRADKNNAQAMTLLGTLHAQQQDFSAAVKLLSRSLEIDPRQPFALNSLGNALNSLRRYENALGAFDKAIALKPDHAAAFNNRGSALRGLDRLEDALASIDRAIGLNPDYPEAFNNRGLVLHDLHRHEDALKSYERALALKPAFAEVHKNIGDELLELKRFEAALASYDRAIALKADFAAAHNNRGHVLVNLQRYKDALKSFETSIRLDPNAAEVHANRGAVLRTLRRPADSLKSYERALAINVESLEAYVHKGQVLQELRRLADAVQAYDMALALRPDHVGAHHRRAIALKDIERLDEALVSIERAVELDRNTPYVLGERLMIKAQACDWNRLDEASDAVVEAVGQGMRASTPFTLLATPCAEDVRRKCAEIFMRDQHPPRPNQLPPIGRSASDSSGRIRIAYVSGDFRAHAVASLIAGVLEEHDRTRFEVHAISFGPNDKTAPRARLEKAVEHFIDVRDMVDSDVASLMRERNIDIAIDLMGFTGNCRAGILAHRPAPIQVSYLGYPGTMGADYIDYIVADRIVIPETEQRFYAEKVVYLPESYQCNDSKRKIGNRTLDRTGAGLPLDAFVFCSFNNNFKIRPEMFDVWMRILQRSADSVLWLLRSNSNVERNLRNEAEKRGVSGERLVFAPRMDAADHLARHGLADLFLDTQPYGAHTTASDALWTGLPVLTCLGDSFAARVGASLLNAIGLPEMVTRSLEEYEARAVTLAHDRLALAEVKARLARHRDTHPLFDTVRFTRHLEAAFARMWRLYRNGSPPTAFAVEPGAAEG
jgi:protein O-GlcNAc transferase